MSFRNIIIVTALLAGFAALALPLPEGLTEEGRRTLVIGIIMAAFWMSEALPLPVTAMIPLVVFPLAAVGDIADVSQSYAHPLVILFLGGFMLAAALQRWQLDKRLALLALNLAGSRPDHQVLAVMATTAFLSMWISNTAATMVMMPIGLAMLALDDADQYAWTRDETAEHKAELNGEPPDTTKPADSNPTGNALMLGIAYAATIGGMGSLIGTPPNALFAGFVEKSYGLSIGFAQWMALGIPIVLVLLPLAWVVLTRVVFVLPDVASASRKESGDLPPLSREQKLVACVLVAVVLAWVSRPLISEWLGIGGLSDAGIAIAGVLVLFILPARFSGGAPLLGWEDVKSIRWDVLILFGGGLALAQAIQSSGLAGWIGSGVSQLSGIPILMLVLIMMAAIVYLGELASNTAMAAIFLPVAGAAAIGLDVAPLELLVPVALAASLGFMLPVATPPNAIVYGSGAVTSRNMLRAGALLDVVSILVVFVVSITIAPIVFGTGPESLLR